MINDNGELRLAMPYTPGLPDNLLLKHAQEALEATIKRDPKAAGYVLADGWTDVGPGDYRLDDGTTFDLPIRIFSAWPGQDQDQK